MNILVIIGSSGIGGSERVAFNLAKWFTNVPDRHLTVLALRKAKYRSYDTLAYDYIELRSHFDLFGIRRVVKNKQPDIVLTMGVPICIYTVPAIWGMNLKHIISERNDPSHFDGKWIVKTLARMFMIGADGYVFQTRQAMEFYGERIRRKAVVIHNPLSYEYVGVSTTNREKDVVAVGRLNKQKNHILLIRAFGKLSKEFPEYRLSIWGEGPERESLQRYVAELGLRDRVRLHGTTRDIMHKIVNSELFVLCSKFEGMPNALMEAMSLGLPCISADCPCGGPAELITDGKNGLLIPVDDEDALVNAITHMLRDREFAIRMGNEAKNIIYTHSSEIICKQWDDYFIAFVSEQNQKA